MDQHVAVITEREMPVEAVDESAEAVGQRRVQDADRWQQVGYGTQRGPTRFVPEPTLRYRAWKSARSPPSRFARSTRRGLTPCVAQHR